MEPDHIGPATYGTPNELGFISVSSCIQAGQHTDVKRRIALGAPICDWWARVRFEVVIDGSAGLVHRS